MKTKKFNLNILTITAFLSLFLIAFGAVAYAATITGRVTAANGGAAIQNVSVVAFEDSGSGCGAWHAGDTTDSNGDYSITVTDSQNYRISADASLTTCQAFVDEYYSTTHEGTNQCSEADSVAAGASGINFTLEDGYIVSGTVTATNGGAAIENVQVVFYTGSTCNETWFGGRPTDASGDYCFTVLTGTYYIHADASFTTPQPYVNEWYDGSTGATDCTGATGLTVSSAKTVDFALDDKITITGNITDGTNPLNDIAVFLVSGDPCNNDIELITYTRTDSSGDYSIDVTTVPNGNYYLVTGNWSGYINEWWDNTTDPCSATTIALSGSNISGKNFALDQDTTPTLSGTVYQSNGTDPITSSDAPVMFVGLISGDPCSGWWQIAGRALVHPDTGEYMFTNVSPGDYYLRTSNIKQSNYVDEWWTSGGSVWFKDCRNPNVETVNVPGSGGNVTGKNFQLDMGVTVSGTVRNSGGTAITDAEIQVQVMMGSPCEWNWEVKSDLSDSSDGTYSLWGMPAGDYYLKTDNMNQSDYVHEWWVDTDTNYSSYLCANALQLNVPGSDVSNIDFRLDAGGSVSGTVTDSGGPITGTWIQVSAVIGDICDEEEWIGGTQTDTANGTYQIRGLPATVDVYLKTQTDQYANKWWESTGDGTYSCSSAEATNVTSGVNTPNRNFLLEPGGSLSGVVKNEAGDPLQDIEVEYSNEGLREWKQAVTDSGGNFTFSHLAPGMYELSIQPEVNTGFVWFARYDCLEQNENENLGTIRLRNGALVSGYFKDASSIPLQYFEYWYSGKFEIGWGQTDDTGYFALRLPVGNFTLNADEDNGYSTMPVDIEVTNVGTPVDLGTITGYDDTTGEQISGSVTDSASHTGQFEVLAFLNTQDFSPENAEAIAPLSCGEIGVSGNYSLYVVPQSQRSGTLVDVILALFYEDETGLETMTVVDIIEDISTPASTQNLSYTSEGHTVSGFVKDHEGGLPGADVLLYKQPGDVFTGFADPGCDGGYTFYNVPAGTYKIAAISQDYPDDTEWTGSFEVNANVTVPDIFMGKKAMPWIPLLLLGD